MDGWKKEDGWMDGWNGRLSKRKLVDDGVAGAEMRIDAARLVQGRECKTWVGFCGGTRARGQLTAARRLAVRGDGCIGKSDFVFSDCLGDRNNNNNSGTVAGLGCSCIIFVSQLKHSQRHKQTTQVSVYPFVRQRGAVLGGDSWWWWRMFRS